MLHFQKNDKWYGMQEIKFFNIIFMDPMTLVGDINRKINFSRVIFKERAFFGSTTFKEGVHFLGTIFLKEAEFALTHFLESANFIGSRFQSKASFVLSNFQKRTDFRNTIFNNEVDFSMARINTLLFNDTKGDFVLNLQAAQIESIDYSNTKFDKSNNRNTFLILKNLAMKQNDTVSALGFHRKEYDQYRKELRGEGGEWQNRFMLWFEKHVSNYGTDWVMPIILIVGLLALYTPADIYFSKVKDLSVLKYTSEIMSNINAFSIFSVNGSSGKEPLHIILEFFKNLFLVVFLYEVIKSFRKFSRKI